MIKSYHEDGNPIISILPIVVAQDHRLTLIHTRVLIAIFSFRNKDTGVCRVKRETLGERCQYSPRTISEATTQLTALGWLKKVGSGGFSRASEYTITVPDPGTVLDPGTVPDPGTGGVPDPGTQTVPDPGTRIEQSTELSGVTEKNPPNPPKGVPVGFTEFWLAYPKKANKPAAEKAFRKLSPNAELLATIINDVKARVKTTDWQKQGGQFIPHPSTYLNQHGWENPITGAKTPDRVETWDECSKRMFGRLYEDLSSRQMSAVDEELDIQRARMAS